MSTVYDWRYSCRKSRTKGHVSKYCMIMYKESLVGMKNRVPATCLEDTDLKDADPPVSPNACLLCTAGTSRIVWLGVGRARCTLYPSLSPPPACDSDDFGEDDGMSDSDSD